MRLGSEGEYVPRKGQRESDDTCVPALALPHQSHSSTYPSLCGEAASLPWLLSMGGGLVFLSMGIAKCWQSTCTAGSLYKIDFPYVSCITPTYPLLVNDFCIPPKKIFIHLKINVIISKLADSSFYDQCMIHFC